MVAFSHLKMAICLTGLSATVQSAKRRRHEISTDLDWLTTTKEPTSVFGNMVMARPRAVRPITPAAKKSQEEIRKDFQERREAMLKRREAMQKRMDEFRQRKEEQYPDREAMQKRMKASQKRMEEFRQRQEEQYLRKTIAQNPEETQKNRTSIMIGTGATAAGMVWGASKMRQSLFDREIGDDGTGTWNNSFDPEALLENVDNGEFYTDAIPHAVGYIFLVIIGFYLVTNAIFPDSPTLAILGSLTGVIFGGGFILVPMMDGIWLGLGYFGTGALCIIALIGMYLKQKGPAGRSMPVILKTALHIGGVASLIGGSVFFADRLTEGLDDLTKDSNLEFGELGLKYGEIIGMAIALFLGLFWYVSTFTLSDGQGLNGKGKILIGVSAAVTGTCLALGAHYSTVADQALQDVGTGCLAIGGAIVLILMLAPIIARYSSGKCASLYKKV